MYDYISALYDGKNIGSSGSDPLEDICGSLRLQLGEICAAMGDNFSQSLFLHLRAEFHRHEVRSYRTGFQLGGQLMLSMLADMNYESSDSIP